VTTPTDFAELFPKHQTTFANPTLADGASRISEQLKRFLAYKETLSLSMDQI